MPDARRPFALEVPVTLAAVVTPEQGGGYSAEVPALPGCITEADTLDELPARLQEAAQAWLAVNAEGGEPGGPFPTVVYRRGEKISGFLPLEDLKLFHRLRREAEDRIDVDAARAALAEPGEPTSFEGFRRQQGLGDGSES